MKNRKLEAKKFIGWGPAIHRITCLFLVFTVAFVLAFLVSLLFVHSIPDDEDRFMLFGCFFCLFLGLGSWRLSKIWKK